MFFKYFFEKLLDIWEDSVYSTNANKIIRFFAGRAFYEVDSENSERETDCF